MTEEDLYWSLKKRDGRRSGKKRCADRSRSDIWSGVSLRLERRMIAG
jgi:hypothetical protein